MARKNPMKVQIENRQTKIKINRTTIRNTVLKIFRILDCLDKEISICFTDDENIKELNKQYLNRNRATNVLSFSLQEGEYSNINPQMLGDVVISVETAQRDAVKGNLTVEQELDFLLIHGILHLTGYNHENTTEKEAKRMELKEKEIFNQINYRSKTLI
jgi:probable rRNA maturation factor